MTFHIKYAIQSISAIQQMCSGGDFNKTTSQSEAVKHIIVQLALRVKDIDPSYSGSGDVFRLTKKILADAKIFFYLNQPFSFERVMASIRFFTSSFSRIIEI